jgi:hypothetical protein
VPKSAHRLEISSLQLDEILADFSALGRTTYLDDPRLGLGSVATEVDDLGMPEFSPELPHIPVALIERHQALWLPCDDDTARQEVWTDEALAHGMRRIGSGVHQYSYLDGWLVAEWQRDGGGLHLQQTDGGLFVYALCCPDSTWLEAAQHHRGVLVIHGPHLGLRVPPEQEGDCGTGQLRTTELATARRDGLVTGGFMRWGRVATP